MAKRSKIYDGETAKKLRDAEYAEGYLNSAIYNHDTPFKIALADMIDKFGHAELGERIDMAGANVTRQVTRLRADEDIKLDSLQILMKGFGLSLEISARKLESA
jgi:DNA-binding phage protein